MEKPSFILPIWAALITPSERWPERLILAGMFIRADLNLISMSNQFNAVTNTQTVNIPLRPYNLKELATLYGISTKTFNKWLKPFKKIIGPRKGYFFSITQVRMIFKLFEFPSVLYDNG
jgi:hypothetical protein